MDIFSIKRICPLCGQDLLPREEEETRVCQLCQTAYPADAVCPDGHSVCPTCRQKEVRRSIIAHCLDSPLDQPYPLTLELMRLPGVLMHGPEHHLLLAAALLTAYCRQTGRLDSLEEYLEEANRRSLQVPGGACGAWGICGAAVSTGIFLSIATGSSPFATSEWRDAGQLVSRCGAAISASGGPRCCKRDTFFALTEAVEASNAVLGTAFTLPGEIQCVFFPNNRECKGRACPFFPAKP